MAAKKKAVGRPAKAKKLTTKRKATAKKKSEHRKKQASASVAAKKLDAAQTGGQWKVDRWFGRDKEGVLKKAGADAMTGAAITEGSAQKRSNARKAKDKEFNQLLNRKAAKAKAAKKSTKK